MPAAAPALVTVLSATDWSMASGVGWMAGSSAEAASVTDASGTGAASGTGMA